MYDTVLTIIPVLKEKNFFFTNSSIIMTLYITQTKTSIYAFILCIEISLRHSK